MSLEYRNRKAYSRERVHNTLRHYYHILINGTILLAVTMHIKLCLCSIFI